MGADVTSSGYRRAEAEAFYPRSTRALLPGSSWFSVWDSPQMKRVCIDI